MLSSSSCVLGDWSKNNNTGHDRYKFNAKRFLGRLKITCEENNDISYKSGVHMNTVF